MIAASDPMTRAFDSMAGMFHGCSFWMTVLSDYVVGGDKLVIGHACRWNGQGRIIRVSNISLFSCTHLLRFLISSLCVLVPFLPPKQQNMLPEK